MGSPEVLLHFTYGLLIAAFILCDKAVGVGEQFGCDKYLLVDGYQFCFDVYEGTKTKVECASLCEERDSHLPIVRSPEVNTALRSLVLNRFLLDIWLGLEEQRFSWQWMDDRSEVDHQGCYGDSTGHDFFDMVQFADLTPTRCRDHCSGGNYKYYALQNGDECYCGNRLGNYEVTNQCNTPCVGNYSLICGGPNGKQVFSVAGSFSFWDSSQPNNHNNYQSCSLLDHEADLFWNDVACWESHGALCQHDLTEENCQTYSQTNNSRYLAGLCFTMHTERYSWYRWSYECQVAGGHLLHVTTHDQWDEIWRELATLTWETSLWINLANRQWLWQSGEILRYSNWDSSRPNGHDQDCVAMGESGRWDDVSCTLKYSCVCQRDNVTIPEPPTTTTTPGPTTPTTTTVPTTPMPTEPSLFDQYIRWGLVGGSVLLLTIIIAITACCCHISREKAKKERMMNGNFNLFFGVDVGNDPGGSDPGSSEGKDSKDSKDSKENLKV